MTREPTEAEKRAVEAAVAALDRQGDGGDAYVERPPFYSNPATVGFDRVLIDGRINLLPVVQAVIRSLRNPTGEMLYQVTRLVDARPDEKLSWHLDVHRTTIDAASPEIKP